MAGPWEKFKSEPGKPWEKFGDKKPAPPPSDSLLDKDFGPTLPIVGHVPLRPRQTIQALADQLPGAGAMVAGGAAALGTGGVGALPAAGFGGAAGQSLKDQIEMHLLGKPKEALQLALGPAQGALDGATQEMGGQVIGAALAPLGKSIYKSGVKKLDQVGARYGKEPVSDVLLENRVKGSAKEIQQQMDNLADQKLANRNQILKEATDAGGNVNMESAMKPAQGYVNELKAIDNPEQKDALGILQNRIDKYIDYEGNPNITPMQASAWKTSSANRAGDTAYNQMRYSSEAQRFDKRLSSGLKSAIEDSVEQSHPMGDAARMELSSNNADLGKLLTSADRAARDAEIEGSKNSFTSIDGILAGHAMGSHGNLTTLALKKAADLAKTADVRTSVGLGLRDLANTAGVNKVPGYLARPLDTEDQNKNLETTLPPWLRMQGVTP